MYHCGCHGNPVTIATRYAPDAHRPKEPSYQYGLNMTEDKRVIDASLWLPW